DFGGEDRIIRQESGVSATRDTTVIWEGIWIHRNTNSSTASLATVVERSVNGRDIWESKAGISGSLHTTETLSGNGNHVITVIRPDQTENVTVYEGDEIAEVTEYDANGAVITEISYTYDPHGRVKTVTDTQNGETLYAYNNADEVISVTAPESALGDPRQV